MESETIKYLRERHDWLASERVKLRSRLAEVDSELNRLNVAISTLSQRSLPITGLASSAASVAYHRRKASPDIQDLTFKQLIVKALSERFQNGATANQLLDYFKSAWGREIMRTSLSPQLSRLKQDGKINQRGKVWYLITTETNNGDQHEN